MKKFFSYLTDSTTVPFLSEQTNPFYYYASNLAFLLKQTNPQNTYPL